jgi:hypothetical protein
LTLKNDLYQAPWSKSKFTNGCEVGLLSWIYSKNGLYIHIYDYIFNNHTITRHTQKSNDTRRCEVGCEVGFAEKRAISKRFI